MVKYSIMYNKKLSHNYDTVSVGLTMEFDTAKDSLDQGFTKVSQTVERWVQNELEDLKQWRKDEHSI